MSASIDGIRALGINRKRPDTEVGQARIHGVPARPTIGALEHTAPLSACIDGIRALGINRKRHDIEVGQA